MPKLIGRKRARSRSRSVNRNMASGYKRARVIRRRKTPLLGPGAKQIYASCRSVSVTPIATNGVITNDAGTVRIAIPW